MCFGKFPDAFPNQGSLQASDSRRSDTPALDSLLYAIHGNTTNDMLWAVVKGVSNYFGGDLCSEVDTHEDLKTAAMTLLDLGDIKLAERFFRLVQSNSKENHPCFCNEILRQYIEDGARDMCGRSLGKLAALSVFQPNHLLVAKLFRLNQNSRERVMDVLPSLPVSFIEMVDVFPIPAMKFLAGLPPSVQVVSAQSH